MTENDKKIIEIVKDFMPKDLVEGCLVKISFDDHYFDSDGGEHSCTSEYFYKKIEGYGENLYTSDLQGVEVLEKMGHDELGGTITEILGTLDTTVILKYIEKSGYYASMKMCITRNLEEIVIEEGEDSSEEIDFEPKVFYIKNKPYTLLSEEEKGGILEILLELCT